jgi:type IV secretory pathway TrbF-like protein
MSVGCMLLMAGAIVYLAVVHQVRTYVIETDAHGIPMGVVQPILSAGDFSDRIIEASLTTFVEDALTITADWPYDAQILDRSLNRTRGDAHSFLRAFYLDNNGAHDPRSLYTRESQRAKVSSVVRLPTPDWYEVWFTTTTNPGGAQDWKATIAAKLMTPTSDNPLGIVITSLDWEVVNK